MLVEEEGDDQVPRTIDKSTQVYEWWLKFAYSTILVRGIELLIKKAMMEDGLLVCALEYLCAKLFCIGRRGGG